MKRLIQALALAALLAPAALPQSLPTPFISSVVPNETTAGRSDFLIQINGQGFLRDDPIDGITGSRVRWRRIGTDTYYPLQTTYISSTVLRAMVNSELVTAAGDAVIQVQNVSYQTSSKTAPFHINTPPRIDTTSLLTGFVDQGYLVFLEASGGTGGYIWSVSAGELPPGLELDPGGVINGAPTTAGTYDLELTIADTVGVVASARFSLTVVTDVTILTRTPLAAGTVGTPYQLQFQAVGGTAPYQWRIVEGNAPPGLTMSNSGLLSGTPTHAGGYSFQVSVTDARQRTASAVFQVTIALEVAVTTESPLPGARVGEAYSTSLAAAGGTPPYTWTLDESSALPDGLALSAAGMLVGTPQSAGTSQFTVTVFDVQGASASKTFSLTIAPPQLAIVTTSPLPDGAVGTGYSATMQATGGVPPYTWSVVEGSLPPGLSLAADGTLSGTPSQDGTFVFQIQVSDGDPTNSVVSGLFQLVISRGAVAIVTAPYLPAGATGDPYQAALEATGGTPPYSWDVIVGSTPPGVDLASSGVLSGTPTGFGDFGFRARVTDAAGGTAEQNFAVTIAPPNPPQVSVQGLPAVSGPTEQPTFEVNLAAPYPVAIQGRATLTFAPDAVVPADDATVQFAAGGRTLDFTIAPGETTATVPDGELAIQTGSVAGVIRVSVELSSGGEDITPSPQPLQETRVDRAPPVIRSVQVSSVSGGFEVTIVGVSTPREVTQAVFQFTAASGSDLRTTEATVDVNSAFVTWYQDASSAAYGSAFTYRQPFTISGDSNAVTGVTVTLRNSQGDSDPATATF